MSKVAFGWRLVANKKRNMIREVVLLVPPLNSGEGREA